ncbi:RECEPTOR-LIKE PROTEIN 44 [Salix koriyanagi]|uniref:RECEPTOR-LIKE PROTEIN 44 n=1 Tax=Salix koriyanagi TaxID=2511006 RepID=A0A9Q0UMP7_9ROSI|nr:RECEPTOR-LIKE PROTEIN 44 [Salix koriyanagi]
MGFWLVLVFTLLTCTSVSVSDPSDEACLAHFTQSLKDPTNSLQNWTRPNFANPCNGFTSYLPGATCNNGPIPADLQSLVNLAVLNLSSNRLDGEIPPQITMCAYLNVIDLHDNFLSGQIPQQLGLLVRLSTFDVSNNKLTGPIPVSLGNRSGNLPRFNATSFLGNKDLFGYPLPPMKTKGY